MASRPTTRHRKRRTLLSSDEEDKEAYSAPKRHYRSRVDSAAHKHNSQLQLEPLTHGRQDGPSREASDPNGGTYKSSSSLKPQSLVANGSSGASARARHGTIYSFFGSARLSQNQDPNTREISEDIVDGELQDTIEYNSVNVDRYRDYSSKTSSCSAPVAGKEKNTFRNQRFIINSKRPSNGVPCSERFDYGRQRPWVEKYTPMSLEDLAVHKRKVEDVRAWLNNVLSGRERKTLLILRGPSGSGKTATINVLSVTLGFEVVEWHNPVSQNSDANGFVSLSNQFRDFLERSARYGGLTIEQTKPQISTQSASESRVLDKRRKIILLEELPYTLSQSNTGLDSFRSCILNYLTTNVLDRADHIASGRRIQNNIIPMIVLVSEISNASVTGSESITAQRLLGTEVLGHQNTTIIDFNRVAPTILSKALDSIAEKFSQESGRDKTFNTGIIKTLSQRGDVRQAIHTLEFFCSTGDISSNAMTDHKQAKSKRKRRSEGNIPKNENAGLDNIIQRSDSLDLFHAVGKVLYNKRRPRDDTSLIDTCSQISNSPELLMSDVDVDQLADESSTDVSTFVAALHENYVLSCDGNDFVDSLNGCLDFISDADILSRDPTGSTRLPNTFRRGSANRYNNGIDSTHQESMAFQTAVRGLLYSLPYPVKRGMAGRSSREVPERDTYKMYYPESMRLWKEKEENEELIDCWLQVLEPEAKTEAYLTLATPRGDSQVIAISDTASLPLGLHVPRSRRAELAVNILPYWYKIASERYGSMPGISGLSKVVNFGEHKVSRKTKNKRDETLHGSKPNISGYKATKSAGLSDSLSNIQKLVLSDDDIED